MHLVLQDKNSNLTANVYVCFCLAKQVRGAKVFTFLSLAAVSCL